MTYAEENLTISKLAIRLSPRSSKNEIVGIMEDGTVKIKITAAPVDGKANLELVKFLSDILDISSSNIEIISGATSRTKIISIRGAEMVEINKKIHARIKRK